LAGESAEWEVAMGLPVGQRRNLDKIENSLRASDPRLAALFTIFTRLNRDEEMPRIEQLRAGAAYLWMWLRTRPAAARRRWRGAKPGARLRTALFFPVALAVMACTVLIGAGMSGSPRCISAPRAVGTSQLNAKANAKTRACGPEPWSRGLIGR
jgi:hypothetical protein